MVINKQHNKTTNNRINYKNTLMIVTVLMVLVLIMTSCSIPTKQENTSDASTLDITKSNNSTMIDNDVNGVSITKSEITSKASFFAYQSGDTYMEIMAIRASDGTVRTAFNTCQLCQGSGRAFYVQDGDVVVCQNCGNRFTVDQVEVTKGGCNPIPIFDENKNDDGDTIVISSTYLDKNKALFNNWKS